jgi:hypothetical protein
MPESPTITLPLDKFRVIFNAADAADEAELLGVCDQEPCAFCTAMVAAQSAMLDAEETR